MEVIIGLFILWLYFLPTLIANHRKKENTGSIFLLNLFFGWTFLGWIITLGWALTTASPVEQPIIWVVEPSVAPINNQLIDTKTLLFFPTIGQHTNN